jgi:hypothetical protein
VLVGIAVAEMAARYRIVITGGRSSLAGPPGETLP